ncbi:MAG: acetyl/propionyl/methylcrotonyl-CoA carboxylase subunit alpha [Hyphomicrobiales bacterium]|nr:acetyl/propionyl/methylcrotonyl-CoA carboxylase subunit alpha [Hyphomicrobiales bacterium]
MFKKILIANRGEIACRIIKTARSMGIATVAVHSDADKDALHVEMADEAVRLGPAPAAESYLRIDRLVGACRKTGAEAVHPGYGFLAENPKFAAALAQAGIAFVGPGAKAIEAMGDKVESKKFAAAAKVNTIPGHIGIVADAEEAVRIAGEIGYPVRIKASAGGGGKGMRVARGRQEVAEGFERARSEAASSFGDDRVFIEKYITEPRHIEVQVLADGHGNVIHLGERECSIQRRNQKVIEEAPSSFIDAQTRKAMGEQAVALARAAGYTSAGTVEFIVDKERNFYFLEMNTRLQVEHPVTELVTGIDLVEQMIQVAAGEKLAIRQKDVALNGWAIEARVYAEDPYRNFLPSTGRLVRYRPPQEGVRAGATVRNDTGVYEGAEITVYYDPLIAKLIAHAPDRVHATDALSDALDAFTIDGIRHNIPFLSAVMAHPRWVEGRLSTNFIAEEFPDGLHSHAPERDTLEVLAAVATFIDHRSNLRRRRITGQMSAIPFAFTGARVVAVAGERIPVAVADEGDTVTVSFDGEEGAAGRAVELSSQWTPGEPTWHGTVDGRKLNVQVRPILNGVGLSHRGTEVEVAVYTRREAALHALMPVKKETDTAKRLVCPMPGLVTSLAVKVGQEIKIGDQLCVIEAMKMENVLRAERDGKVKKINAKPGDNLAVDAVIMEFE